MHLTNVNTDRRLNQHLVSLHKGVKLLCDKCDKNLGENNFGYWCITSKPVIQCIYEKHRLSIHVISIIINQKKANNLNKHILSVHEGVKL